MESSSIPPVMATKKLWKIVRIVFLMLRKRISKSKLLLDLHHLMTKRGKILEKVISNLMFHSNNTPPHLTFVSSRDYQFSCSNSPALPPPPLHVSTHHHHNKRGKKRHSHHTDTDDVIAVQKILEMLNNEAMESPSPVLPGFGFGRSPMVRQLRITDSPYPLRDVDEKGGSEVDKEAEEFIEKFYEQLRLQKIMATPESRNQTRWARGSS